MREWRARCRCGALTATCIGAPVRVSACHCRACQRRTGGPFSTQARFPTDRVTIKGDFRIWEHVADSGRRAWHRWCVECGATIAYTNEGLDGVTAIPIGAFADNASGAELPTLTASVFEEYKQPWLRIEGEGISHED